MRVYRYEHLTKGFGPLCGSGIRVHRCPWEAFFRNHEGVDNFEEIFKQGLPKGIDQDIHLFGMESLESLFALSFTYTQEDLAKYDFYLFEYEVPDTACVVFPDSQVVFDRDQSSVITIHDAPLSV